MPPVVHWCQVPPLLSLFVCTIRKIKYFQRGEEKLTDQLSLSVPFVSYSDFFFFFFSRGITYGLNPFLVEATHNAFSVCLCVSALWEIFKRVEKVFWCDCYML